MYLFFCSFFYHTDPKFEVYVADMFNGRFYCLWVNYPFKSCSESDPWTHYSAVTRSQSQS